jgi:hypothetical protein
VHELVICPDWAEQIGQLRERLTEDTNIIRRVNNFYRCCRNGPSVALRVAAPERSVALQLRPSDLYITQVDLATDVGRYATARIALGRPARRTSAWAAPGSRLPRAPPC